MQQILCDDFSIWLKGDGKSDNTIRAYINALKKLAAWFETTEGHFEPGIVTTLHIYDFQSYMINNEKLVPPTVNKIIAALKTYYKYLVDTGILKYNPMLKVKMKRVWIQYEAPKWLTKQEISKFYHSIENNANDKHRYRDLAICRLMSGSGLRVEEVSNLNIGDICLDKRREDVIVRNGKGGNYRIVPLNSDVIDSLQHWLTYRSDVDEPLFISNLNMRIQKRTINYMVNKYAQIAFLNNVSPHSLRHTFGKSLIDQGIGIERVAYLMGHSSLETTRRYTQPSRSDLRNAVQSISEIK